MCPEHQESPILQSPYHPYKHFGQDWPSNMGFYERSIQLHLHALTLYFLLDLRWVRHSYNLCPIIGGFHGQRAVLCSFVWYHFTILCARIEVSLMPNTHTNYGCRQTFSAHDRHRDWRTSSIFHIALSKIVILCVVRHIPSTCYIHAAYYLALIIIVIVYYDASFALFYTVMQLIIRSF